MDTTFSALLADTLSANGLAAFAGEETIARLSALADLLLRENAHMNLTAITDPRGVAARHFADSLTAAPLLPPGASVIDVGCGAGFPALPLAIARPDLTITALDATAKRIAFVSAAAAELSLPNLSAVAARAEEYAHGSARGSYTAAVSRAVARLNILGELCLPFLAPGGVFVAMKGDLTDAELAEAVPGLALLGGEAPTVTRFSLLGEDFPQARALVQVKKIRATPADYPRDFSRIKKKPL